MLNVRRRDIGDQIGAAAQRTLLGAAHGAGMATTIARLATQPLPVASVRSSTGYSQTLTHGPGSDLEHTFTYDFGSAGLWLAQVIPSTATASTESGQFTIGVSGDTPAATIGPFSLDTSSGAVGTSFNIAVNGSTLHVACSVVAFEPEPVTFTVSVVAFRIS